jgi:transcriptional regulator GlxA family with amidase domain
LLPPGFANLSFAPLAVFEAANMVLQEPYYELHVVSARGGSISNSFGMMVETKPARSVRLDTLLIGATPDTRKPPREVLDYVGEAPKSVRRIASICVGAFILGEAGLLNGRRATTHWMFGDELQKRFPKIIVEIDRIFIADGPIWTSAGMTAGIDLALSLVERDLGVDKTRDAARALVVHQRRAGGQSQHSAVLSIGGQSDRVQSVIQYARSHLGKNLSIESLASVAGLSPRQFSRIFRMETGLTPAKAVENLRLETARFMLEQGRLSLEAIAKTSGFADRERMRRSFVRTLGQTPQAIRNSAPILASL